MSPFRFAKVDSPSDAQVDAAVALFTDLMTGDAAITALTGGEPELVSPMARATIRACIHGGGEFYEATTTEGDFVAFTLWMPPGHDLFSTEEQKALGLNDFLIRLPDVGKDYYKAVYFAQFPGFLVECLGPTGKLDSWWLHMAMVKPEYQGRGIAKSLIDIVKEKAAKNGDCIAFSTTTDKNAQIYTKMGIPTRGRKIMPSPWGEWPLYVLSLDTKYEVTT